MGVVNRTAGALSFSTSNPIAIPAVASGNSLLILITSVANRAPTSLTDNGGGSPSYALDVDGQQLEGSDAASSPRAYIFRRNNITTGPTQVTITTADNAAGTYNIIEYDNLSAAGPAESNIATRSFATSNTATVTTGAANRIGVGFAGSGSNTRDHATSDTGWVTPSAPTGAVGARSFDNPDLGAAGSESLTTTIPTAQWLVTALYTYAAAAGPAQEATGDGDLDFGLDFAFAGAGAVAVPGIQSDVLKEPNAADQNVANASNVTVRIWHGDTITGAPDEVLTNQSIASGVLSFRAAVSVGDPVSYQARWTVDTEDRFFEVIDATAIDLNA